jgi:cholesterol transport system auxiliary component
MIRTRGEVGLRVTQEADSQHQDADRCKVRRTRVLAVMVVGGLLSGCGATRPSKYYQLTVPADAATAAVEKPGAVPVTLLLGTLFTTHLYREDRIIYGNGAEEMGTYEYQRWAEPPTEMIEEVLLRELRASGRYRAVSFRRSNMRGDFAIRGRLYDFKEVDSRPITARVTLELEMRDLKTGATVWTQYYSHDEPVSSKDVPAIVAALDRNVQRGVKEVVASLDQYFASHPVK